MIRIAVAVLALAIVAGNAALPRAARADVVVLKSGARMEGQVVDQDDKSITLRMNNAEIEVTRDKIKEIIQQKTPRQLYEKMLEVLDDNDPDGHYQIALYCMKEGMKDEAIELLRRAVQLKPDHQDAQDCLKEIVNPAAKEMLEKGRKLAKEGRQGKARECFAKVVETYPENDFLAQAKAAIAESYMVQQNYSAAMDEWYKILKDDQHNTRAFLGAVLICEQIGQFDKAAEILEGVLNYEKDEQVRKQCEEKRTIIGRIVEARKAAEQEPDNPDSYATIAAQLDKLGQPAMALKWAEQAAAKGSRDLALVEKLARHFDKEMLVVKALRYWSYLKDLKPPAILAREADERIAQLNVLKLIPEYVQRDTAPDRRKEILARLTDAKLPFTVMEAVTRKWLEYPDAETKGIVTRTVQLDDGSSAAYALYVPEKYDPAARWPLVLALHPAGGTGDTYVTSWARFDQARGYFLLAPTADKKSGWSDNQGRQIVTRSLADVLDAFNIDTNRVFIDGASMGAHATWRYGLGMPDQFAGLVSRSGGVDSFTQLFLGNAVNLPVYIIHGMKDTIVPMEAIKPAKNILAQMGYEVEWRLDAKGGHSSYESETPRILQWMSNHTRDPYPRKVRFLFNTLATPRSYWLQAEVLADDIFDPSKPVKIPKIAGEPIEGEMLQNYLYSTMKAGMGQLTGDIDGNAVRVNARHVVGYTLLLDDRMVNLDRPVDIFTNGKKDYSGKVERSLKFMLDWARRSRDPEMVYSTYVRVVLGSE